MTRKIKANKNGEAVDWSGNLWWENTPPSRLALGVTRHNLLFVEGITNQAPGICSEEGTRDIKEESQNGTGPFLQGFVHSHASKSVLLAIYPINLACLSYIWSVISIFCYDETRTEEEEPT